MKRHLVIAAITLPLLLVLDFLWIGLIGAEFYKTEIGYLMTGNPVWWAAILFYALYSVALAYFVIVPALAKRSLKHAFSAGAFFGLTAFATYDLTNQATVAGWDVLMTVVDIIWGTLQAGIVSVAAYFLATKTMKL